MNKRTISFCFLLIVMVAAGCEHTEALSPKNLKAETGREKILLIGLIPDRDIFNQIECYEPLAGYLSKKVNITIRLAILPRYGNIINNFVSPKSRYRKNRRN